MRRWAADQTGGALVIVLIMILLLTVIGTAMVTATLTEISIAFNQGDASSANFLADAGIARAINEFLTNAGWAGTGGPVALGDGTYDVSVVSSGSIRYITSTGVSVGARRVLRAGVKVVPRASINSVFTNTTAIIGSGTPLLTVSNTLPSVDATAVHANNALGAATAITVNLSGAIVIGGLTSNGPISGVTCATWPWRCDQVFGAVPLPRLDADSAALSSYKSRAKNTFDSDGKNLYFRGGDPTSRCTSGGGYNFGLGQTQRCWDKYVSDRTGAIGATIAAAVFYVEFNDGERTRYTIPTLAIGFRSAASANNGGGSTSLTIAGPGGLVANDVMIAAVSVRGGSGTTITAPAGWASVNTIDNGTTIRMAIYYKVATGAEPASYVWSFSSAQKASGGIQVFSNVDTAAPIDVEAGQSATTEAGGSLSTPSITTTIANTRLVASFAVATGTTFTPPGGMTERYDTASTGGGARTRTASEGAETTQVAAGSTGTKTATSGAGSGVAGVAHLLALRPGGPTVDCVGYVAAVETLCIRSRAATDSNNVVVYANSDLRQVTGAIVTLRRLGGLNVRGDIVFENFSLRTADYTHRSLTGDPAFIAAGMLQIISSGAPLALRNVEITGIVYTFAGSDNPDVNNNLQGSGSTGVDVQHGADLVTLTFNGFIISNGSIALRDIATNFGTVSVLYDAAVADTLPSAFTASSTDNIPFTVSWSSGD